MNQPLIDELLAMKVRDIEARTRLLQEGRLYGDYADEMQQVHRENAKRLEALVVEYGWPGISVVGLEGCQAAWLIAQHSICTPDLQRKFLSLMEEALGRGDVPKKQVAYLTDRIRFNEDKPQVYGTVLDWNEHGELACNVEDPENLDARRSEVGLPPYHQGLKKHQEEVLAEGGTPPENYQEYKRKARAWATSVGWIPRT